MCSLLVEDVVSDSCLIWCEMSLVTLRPSHCCNLCADAYRFGMCWWFGNCVHDNAHGAEKYQRWNLDASWILLALGLPVLIKDDSLVIVSRSYHKGKKIKGTGPMMMLNVCSVASKMNLAIYLNCQNKTLTVWRVGDCRANNWYCSCKESYKSWKNFCSA